MQRVVERRIGRNVDNAGERVTGAGNHQLFGRNRGLVCNQVALGCSERRYRLDGNVSGNAGVDVEVYKQKLVFRLDKADVGETGGHKVLAIQVNALCAQFGLLQVYDHGDGVLLGVAY